jgi:hypothetical protein
MPKRPAFQFYPGDWMNDLNLRQCSPVTRAVWVDLLCLMHEGEPYGHLATATGKLEIPWLANRLGMRVSALLSSIKELEKYGVSSVNTNGFMYSRRMVRDELLRIERTEYGKLSTNHPNVPTKNKDTPMDIQQGYVGGSNAVPSPSSSSSSSSSSSEEKRENTTRAPDKTELQKPPPGLQVVPNGNGNSGHLPIDAEAEARVRKLADAAPDQQDYESGVKIAMDCLRSAMNPDAVLRDFELNIPLWWAAMRDGRARIKPLRFVIADKDYLKKPREPTENKQERERRQIARNPNPRLHPGA